MVSTRFRNVIVPRSGCVTGRLAARGKAPPISRKFHARLAENAFSAALVCTPGYVAAHLS